MRRNQPGTCKDQRPSSDPRPLARSNETSQWSALAAEMLGTLGAVAVLVAVLAMGWMALSL